MERLHYNVSNNNALIYNTRIKQFVLFTLRFTLAMLVGFNPYVLLITICFSFFDFKIRKSYM